MNYKPYLILLLFLLVLVFFALSTGPLSINLLDIIKNSLSDYEWRLLLNIRLPRIILAIIVGGVLAICGATMQGLFRNPLADPALLGISSGAAMSVAIGIVFFQSITATLGYTFLSVFAFIGALLSTVVVLYFARVGSTFSVTYMLLAGIAMNAITGAGTGLMTYLSTDEQLRSLTFWTMGNLGHALWPAVVTVGLFSAPCLWLLFKDADKLNILMLGERDAKSLGVNVSKLKKRLVILTALAVGACVSVSGIIGFVALVIPHISRMLFTPDHRHLIPISGILGAVVLLFCDTVSRTLLAPAEFPVALVTSLLGGPYFIYLMRRQLRSKTHA